MANTTTTNYTISTDDKSVLRYLISSSAAENLYRLKKSSIIVKVPKAEAISLLRAQQKQAIRDVLDTVWIFGKIDERERADQHTATGLRSIWINIQSKFGQKTVSIGTMKIECAQSRNTSEPYFVQSLTLKIYTHTDKLSQNEKKAEQKERQELRTIKQLIKNRNPDLHVTSDEAELIVSKACILKTPAQRTQEELWYGMAVIYARNPTQFPNITGKTLLKSVEKVLSCSNNIRQAIEEAQF